MAGTGLKRRAFYVNFRDRHDRMLREFEVGEPKFADG